MSIDQEKIQKMREGGKIAVEIFRLVLDAVEPGVTTVQLDEKAEALCKKYKVKPAFKGYMGFPAVLCVGPNDTVVHGVPDDRELEDGDILSVDFGIVYKGVYLDMARTLCVGKVSRSTKKFVRTVELALGNAVKAATIGNTIGDIGHAIQSTVEKEGYSVVREMVGHGVGYKLHESPLIPGYGVSGKGEKLKKGQTLAIEAIINEGDCSVDVSKEDNWTTWTRDGKLSALFENTVLVLDKPEILTPI